MRPLLHFTAQSGWINDPHGITFRDGVYHSFYQFVPGSTTWAPNCHWGHAVGPDLLSLTERPVAIAPGDGDDGIWTGSLVPDGRRARVFYTSTSQPDIGIGRIRVADSIDDDWNDWVKGPVVAEAPSDLEIIAYRDPFIMAEGSGWRMFVGAATADGTAMALSYTSTDLETWAYDGITLQRSTNEVDPVWMGALWECPQFLQIDGRWIMISSVWDDDVLHYAGYAVGSYNEGIFTPETWGRLTFGTSYYAPSLFTDAAGRPCIQFWLRGVSDAAEGWASTHSFPYVLSLDGNRLVATPHPDVEAHRLATPQDGGLGTAADITWESMDGGGVSISAGPAELLEAHRSGSELVLSTPSGELGRVPVDGPVRLLLDGPVLEVASAAGLFASPVPGAGAGLKIAVSSGAFSVFPLA